MKQRISRLVELFDQGFTVADVKKKIPTITQQEIDTALTTHKAYVPPPRVSPETPKQLKERLDLPITERNEILATQMETIVQATLSLFNPADIAALTPRERVLLISSFTEKMRLLRGESTDNIAVNSFLSLVEEVAGERERKRAV